MAENIRELGSYEIVEKIGQGGMGIVFKARQKSLGRIVVLKVIDPEVAKDESFVKRFYREGRIAAKLNHPNIPRVYDLGEDKGRLFLVMEYVEGEDLAEILEKEGKWPVLSSLEMTLQIVEALHHAHSHGIMHRDVKPSNIIISQAGVAKLTDMGLAKKTAASELTKITMTGYVMGTPDYMSPEQITDPDSVDERTDIYSLGATFFHMVTGTTPFKGKTLSEVMVKIARDKLHFPAVDRRDLPTSVKKLIRRMMDKDRNRRFRSAQKLSAAIKRVIEGLEEDRSTPVVSEARPKRKTFSELEDETDTLAVFRTRHKPRYKKGALLEQPPRHEDESSLEQRRRHPLSRKALILLASSIPVVAILLLLLLVLPESPQQEFSHKDREVRSGRVPESIDFASLPVLSYCNFSGAEINSNMTGKTPASRLTAELLPGDRYLEMTYPNMSGAILSFALTKLSTPYHRLFLILTHSGKEKDGICDTCISVQMNNTLLERSLKVPEYSPFGRARWNITEYCRTGQNVLRIYLRDARSPYALKQVEIKRYFDYGEFETRVNEIVTQCLTADAPYTAEKLFSELKSLDEGNLPQEARAFLQEGIVEAGSKIWELKDEEQRQIIDKINSLASQGKFRDALALLEDVSQYPIIARQGSELEKNLIERWIAEKQIMERADALFSQQQYDAALAVLETGIPERYRTPQLTSEISDVRKAKRETQAKSQAEPCLKAAQNLVQDKKWAKALAVLNEFLSEYGDTAAAENIRKKAEEIRAGWVLTKEEMTSILAKGEGAYRKGDWNTAIETFQKILETLPDGAQASKIENFLYLARIEQTRASASGVSKNILEGLVWLARHQDKNGQWDQDGFQKNCDTRKSAACDGQGTSQYDVAVTGLALLAFIRNGYTHRKGLFKNTVQRGLDWLVGQQQGDGSLGPRLAESWIYNHAIGTMVLCEVYAATGANRLKVPVQKAVKFIREAQNPGLGWKYEPQDGRNDTSVTGWMVAALKAAKAADLNVEQRVFSGALNWFDRVTSTGGKQPAGKCGYMRPGDDGSVIRKVNEHYAKLPTMTAVAVACRISCGWSRKDPKILQGINILMANLPEWNKPSNLKVDFYYWYYGTLAMSHYGGQQWQRWKGVLKKALLDTQRVGGCADGSWDPVGKWGMVGGRVYSTAIGILCLQLTEGKKSSVRKDSKVEKPPKDTSPVSAIITLKNGEVVEGTILIESDKSVFVQLSSGKTQTILKKDIAKIEKTEKEEKKPSRQTPPGKESRKEPKEPKVCDRCGGLGEITCIRCKGSGKVKCSGCTGSGHVPCSKCDGAGRVQRFPAGTDTCPRCGGSGRHTCRYCKGSGQRECPSCKGSGKKKCPKCRGTGEK